MVLPLVPPLPGPSPHGGQSDPVTAWLRLCLPLSSDGTRPLPDKSLPPLFSCISRRSPLPLQASAPDSFQFLGLMSPAPSRLPASSGASPGLLSAQTHRPAPPTPWPAPQMRTPPSTPAFGSRVPSPRPSWGTSPTLCDDVHCNGPAAQSPSLLGRPLSHRGALPGARSGVHTAWLQE